MTSEAYPEFVGYKYTSCLTCHYNSQGGGSINDYGRALWSAEIAGRMWAGKKSSEQLAEESGFLGKTQLPWWLKPGLKARQLWYQRNPGGSPESTDSAFITMQAEANLSLILDKEYKYMLVGSFGYAPTPRRYENQPGSDDIDNWISRTHYFRWQAMESLFVFAGMMDKAYGIRIVDHTAFSRSRTGVAQNDQVHGVMLHWIKPTYEITLHPYIGNLFQESDVRQSGVSGIVDFDVGENWRIGVSALSGSNQYIDQKRYAIHSRNGLSLGSSILFEFGIIENAPQNADSTQGYYLYSQYMQKLFRGYHVFMTGESTKADMIADQPTNIKTSIGLLAFPMPRYELRIEGQNVRTLRNSSDVPNDTWALLVQAHLSL